MKLIDALTEERIVPDKFYLAGHSIGGWLCAQYGTQCPERVEGLFMMTPAGTCPFDEATWDPYSMKDPNDLGKDRMEAKKVDKIIKNIKNKVHPLIELQIYPRCATYKPTKKWVDECFRDDVYPEEVKRAAFDYFWCMVQRPSIIDTLEL